MAFYIKEEVREALFMMKLMGALNPDGFPACFYQKHWSTIEKVISHFVIEVLTQRYSLDCVNNTFITLIPKIKDAQKVGDYKPISLCNVIYKLVAKVLANKLKMILPRIIYPNQSDDFFLFNPN